MRVSLVMLAAGRKRLTVCLHEAIVAATGCADQLRQRSPRVHTLYTLYDMTRMQMSTG